MNLALPLLPGAFMQWALISVDSVLIFHYLGDGPTGAYSSAYSIASIAMLIPLALNSVWYATAQRLLARSVAALARFATGVGALVVFGGALLTAIAAAAGPLVTAKWLVEPVFRAVPECLPWLVVGFTLLALAKVAEGIVYAFGHPRLILAASVAAGAVNFGLNLLWIPAHGIVGAAWATAVGYGVLAGCLVLFAVATLARGGERRGAVAAG
jgi:O-antigen/teichoic acid export membrane protein